MDLSSSSEEAVLDATLNPKQEQDSSSEQRASRACARTVVTPKGEHTTVVAAEGKQPPSPATQAMIDRAWKFLPKILPIEEDKQKGDSNNEVDYDSESSTKETQPESDPQQEPTSNSVKCISECA